MCRQDGEEQGVLGSEACGNKLIEVGEFAELFKSRNPLRVVPELFGIGAIGDPVNFQRNGCFGLHPVNHGWNGWYVKTAPEPMMCVKPENLKVGVYCADVQGRTVATIEMGFNRSATGTGGEVEMLVNVSYAVAASRVTEEMAETLGALAKRALLVGLRSYAGCKPQERFRLLQPGTHTPEGKKAFDDAHGFAFSVGIEEGFKSVLMGSAYDERKQQVESAFSDLSLIMSNCQQIKTFLDGVSGRAGVGFTVADKSFLESLRNIADSCNALTKPL